ncbi:AfsR/SARP family transcriptional regulator [Longispora albida]|uniref:AfsR/SARP family transcriptional regulator n=1 Tax=Longispora albida TaxID=203523 RepID=UPI00037E2C49|nr:BTAD domain-containing putative transcriptional regulator [Longispora albida]
MLIAVLGPVRAGQPGTSLALGPAMQRTVLAQLALEPGQPIPPSRLIEGLWDTEPPPRAPQILQSYVSRLRTVLRPAGAGIGFHDAGYVLDVPAEQVDVCLFRAAVARGLAGDDPAPFREGLALWRGEPLAGVKPSPLIERIQAGLAAERLAALEECLERELAAGRHREVLPELTALCADHPWRERFLAQLMLALYRSGRMAEALQRYEDARRQLAGELGVDPARSLADLHTAILRGDPALDLPVSAPVPAPAVQVQGPRLLPFAVPDFTGRAAEIRQLLGLAGGTATAVVISAIDGMAGAGKTATALHVAHELSAQFPDGQYFVDLHGFTPGRAQLDPGAALGTLLRAAGLPAERIPFDTDERSGLWRDTIAGRRAVIVLDNAASAQQVRPLLPGTPGALVLITSRRRLPTVDGAAHLTLGVLPPGDAYDLFVKAAGPHVLSEPDAVAEVVRLCGYLPLAIRIAAALAGDGRGSVARLARQLGAERKRLRVLSLDDRDVSAAFALSLAQLPPGHGRMFRLLGQHPGTDFETTSAAALAGVDQDEAETLLEGLTAAHLLQRARLGRYTFHDLLREYARTTLAAGEPEPERAAALTRLLDHYRDTAAAAIGLVVPGGPGPATADGPAGFADAEEAGDWLSAELASLVAAGSHAARNGWPAHAIRLATTLRQYLDRHGHHAEAALLHGEALHAARVAGDQAGEALALVELGWAVYRQGQYEQAAGYYRQAIGQFEVLGDGPGQARAHGGLGNVFRRQRDNAAALEHHEHALKLARAAGYHPGEAASLGSLAVIHTEQRDFALAVDYTEQALALFRVMGNRHSEMAALQNLGLAHCKWGNTHQAIEYHNQALSLSRELGNRRGEADALVGLGEVATSTGDHAAARAAYAGGLAIAEEAGYRPEQALAHEHLAQTSASLGDHDGARHHAHLALGLYTSLGLPQPAAGMQRLLSELSPGRP